MHTDEPLPLGEAPLIPGIITRLIIRDIIIVTALSLMGVTGLLTIVGALFEGGKTGLDPFSILSFIPFIVAPSLPYTLPCCLLLAVTFVFGGMSGSNEITALKASGVNVLRLFIPAVLLAIGMTALNVYLVDRVIPSCHRQFKQLLLGDMKTALFTYLKENNCIQQHSFPFELYIKSIDEGRLIQPIIKQKSQKAGEYAMILQAEEATLEVVPSVDAPGEAEIVMRLVEGVLTTQGNNNAYFKDRTERLPLPSIFGDRAVGLAEQNFSMLEKQASAMEQRLAEQKLMDAVDAALFTLAGTPDVFPTILEARAYDAHVAARKAHRSRSEVQERIARSASSIPFILLGCPVSVLLRRREIVRTFFLCFIPIITLYYPVMIMTLNVMRETESRYWVMLWIPTLLMGVGSIPFLRRVYRY